MRVGKLAEYDVVMNYGDRDTADVGTEAWKDPEIIVALRKYIYEGGGFIGMGQPTAAMREGKFFQLAEALGVDEELCFSIINHKYNYNKAKSHFITEDVNGEIDYCGDLDNIYALDGAQVLGIAEDRYCGLGLNRGHVRMACNDYGKGRSFYMTGMACNPENTRLLYRALLWTAKKYADEIGENALAIRCNCLDKESIIAAKKEVNESFGAVNFLINGAGGNNPRASTDNETMTPDLEGVKDFFALEESGLKFVFDLNITSAFLVTQVFAEDMVKTGGNIINISSMNAYRPLTKIPAYSAAKAGISNFTQWLAVHFAPCSIRCNAIAPGFFVTNQNRSLLFNEDGTPTARTGKILAATPMKKFGEISDLIGTLMWLVDDKASGFVTGTVIPVDGGFSAYSGV